MNSPKSLLVILIFSSLTISTLPSFAQYYEWTWARSGFTINTPSAEGLDLAMDSSENLYVVGYHTNYLSFGFYLLNLKGPSFITKYDSNGNVLWAKQDSSGSLYTITGAYGVCTDVFGNCYISGSFRDTVYFGSIRLIGSHFFNTYIVKYNPMGNVIWAKNSTGFSQDCGFSIAADHVGNIYIVGAFTQTVVFGSDTLTSVGRDNAYIVKYDSSGNELWAKSGNDLGRSSIGSKVSVDINDNVYMTGDFDSTSIIFGTDTLFNSFPNRCDAFVVKFDPFGNVIWLKKTGGPTDDRGTSVASDLVGDVYSIGLTNFERDSYITKYNSFGNILWNKYLTGAMGFNITTDRHGNVYACGGFYSPSINIIGDTILFPPPASSDPMFIVKYDSTGHLLFALTLTNGGDDYCSILVSQSDQIYISGDYSGSPFILGNDTLSFNGSGEQVFTAKFYIKNELYNFSNNNLTLDKLLVSPNPNTGKFLIQLNKIISIKIFNYQGQIVFNENQIYFGQKDINFIASKGIYFLVVSDGIREYSQKIIIE